MPILLTTPYELRIGQEPNPTCPRAKLVHVAYHQDQAHVYVEIGDVVSDVWTKDERSSTLLFIIEGDEFNTLMNTATNDGESLYEASKRISYAWLQAHDSEFAGTIE